MTATLEQIFALYKLTSESTWINIGNWKNETAMGW